jgi:hypothetical protein
MPQESQGGNKSMGGKNVVIGAVLIVVVIAVIFTAKRMTGAPPPPDYVMDQKVEKIDYESQDLITESLRDWIGKYAPDAAGRFKNPKTGKYTMVDAFKCGACGELIPVLQVPPELQPKTPEAPPAASGDKSLPPPMHGRSGIDPTVMMKLRQEYKCPKCGKSPFMF